MARFFSYDNLKHRHSFYVYDKKNESNEIIGYVPLVYRVNAKTGGLSERISDKYPDLKNKEFPSEKLAREFAIDFFEKLQG